MRIEKIQTNNYKHKIINHRCNEALSFGNKISIPATKTNKTLEYIADKIGFLFRLTANRIRNNNIRKESYKNFWEKFSKIEQDSPEYTKYLYDFSKKIGMNKEVEINLESRRLLDVVNSDNSYIFIMNHENQKHDPKMLGIINALLYGAYLKADKASSCPKLKILFNEAILNSMETNQRKIMEKFGAIGINASLFNTNKSQNASTILSLLKDFVKNKSHIFVFPEGKMVYFNNVDLKYKFQTGIAELVYVATKIKKDVKVMPVGFYYNKQSENFLGSIYIGEPIIFKQENKKIFTTKGNIESEFATENYKKFFSNIKSPSAFKEITEQGKPINLKNVSDYIAGILCENLEICKKEAKKQLPQLSVGDNIKTL